MIHQNFGSPPRYYSIRRLRRPKCPHCLRSWGICIPGVPCCAALPHTVCLPVRPDLLITVPDLLSCIQCQSSPHFHADSVRLSPCLRLQKTHTANATVHHILIPCHHRIQITGCEKAYLLCRIRQMDHSQLRIPDSEENYPWRIPGLRPLLSIRLEFSAFYESPSRSTLQ